MINSSSQKKNVLWVWQIGIIILIGLLIYTAFYFKSRTDLITIPLILLSGSVGGLAHAMFYHDNKLIYPKKGNDEQDTWFTLGFFSDIFLGAVAGLVGAFALGKAETIQIVYVAILSGFGGGAFLKNKADKNDNGTLTDSDTSILNVPPLKELSNGTSLPLNASIKLGNIEIDVTKEVNWSSSKDTIVSVDKEGLITALGNGESIITATIPGKKNLSATCKVKVG